MAQNTIPVFALPNTIGMARTSAANTARDGSGTLVTLFTSGANGSRIDKVVVTSAQATAAASSAMVGRLFVTDAAGANPRMLAEVAILTATPSTTVVGATSTITFPGGLILVAGQVVSCTQSVYAGAQDQMDWVVQQGGGY